MKTGAIPSIMLTCIATICISKLIGIEMAFQHRERERKRAGSWRISGASEDMSVIIRLLIRFYHDSRFVLVDLSYQVS